MCKQDENRGQALQLVTLNMEEKKVEVNEDALAILEKTFKKHNYPRVATISVMGAFRTGKSFLLDLFLRYLRHDEKANPEFDNNDIPKRGAGNEYPLPSWLKDSGMNIEGGNADAEGGFRFKGGMDHCTEGIWVWSEVFMRKIDGEDVALLLMDTQGAWDGKLTQEQSATIFGMTALISSKQIYNIKPQIQQDKVENLAYFMRFAQAALRKASAENSKNRQDTVEQPFQAIDFLVRDWQNFEDHWDVDSCSQQMKQHLDQHLNPERLAENGTAKALQEMFANIGCFCLPHPGLKLAKSTWDGDINDIDNDFVRFLDMYVRKALSDDVKVKTILGSEMTGFTFPLVFRQFVKAFQEAAPVAMSFIDAMSSATVLLAKEQATKKYVDKMDAVIAKNTRGLKPDELSMLHRSLSKEIHETFEGVTILGSEETRSDTWCTIQDFIDKLFKKYAEENCRKLERALIPFANIALIAILLFVLDRASDYTCDWWSSTCHQFSKFAFVVYLGIFAFIGYHGYQFKQNRGGVETLSAFTELWKEMIRLTGLYAELVKKLKVEDVTKIVRKGREKMSGLRSKAKKE